MRNNQKQDIFIIKKDVYSCVFILKTQAVIKRHYFLIKVYMSNFTRIEKPF